MLLVLFVFLWLKTITMDKIAIIRRPVMQELEELKALFEDSLTSETPLLNQVLGYIKKRNGKMMRPLLVLLMAKLSGQVTASSYHGALSGSGSPGYSNYDYLVHSTAPSARSKVVCLYLLL